MTDLSPAAEWVLNAVTLNRYDVPYYACPKSIDQIRSDVAAALHALADQVVPADPCGDDCCITTCESIRAEILSIAAELKNNA